MSNTEKRLLAQNKTFEYFGTHYETFNGNCKVKMDKIQLKYITALQKFLKYIFTNKTFFQKRNLVRIT